VQRSRVVVAVVLSGVLAAACGAFTGGDDDDSPGASPSSDGGADARPDTTQSADAGVDGAGDAGDGAAPPLVVFLTSVKYANGTHFSSAEQADQLCAGLADQSANPRLKGHAFMAWLSKKGTSAPARLNAGSRVYARPDGTRVGTIADLLGGAPHPPLSVFENGAESTAIAETGTETSGVTGFNCGDWKDTTGSTGLVGNAKNDNVSWMSVGVADCGTAQRLYCFEVP
jgi:hypothetical protein